MNIKLAQVLDIHFFRLRMLAEFTIWSMGDSFLPDEVILFEED